MSLPASEGHLILDVIDNPLPASSRSSAKRHWSSLRPRPPRQVLTLAVLQNACQPSGKSDGSLAAPVFAASPSIGCSRMCLSVQRHAVISRQLSWQAGCTIT